MNDISRLQEAFLNFTEASKSLQEYYSRLHDQVRYLTLEVNEKNRQLADALEKTEEAKDYLKGILENLGDAIIVLDTDMKVSMMNMAAEALLQTETSFAIGRSFSSLAFRLVREGGETILTVADKKYNVIVSHSEIRDSGRGVRGHVILFKDITRIKELEAQNERNHRLIAMGEMAAKIVHEIRSPLCSIELYAGMLAKDLEGTKHMNLAEGISTGISSLNNILTNMLFFAKPQKPVFRPLDICRLLNETSFMLMPMMESRGIRFQKNMSEGVQLQGDPDLLKQVFLNILLNAIQATSEEGVIAASCIHGDGGGVIEIADNGSGIEPCNMEKIFDPFFSTKEKGTGLGLAISAKIVRAHGGTIKVSSEKGCGTIFRLSFPDVPRESLNDIIKCGVI